MYPNGHPNVNIQCGVKIHNLRQIPGTAAFGQRVSAWVTYPLGLGPPAVEFNSTVTASYNRVHFAKSVMQTSELHDGDTRHDHTLRPKNPDRVVFKTSGTVIFRWADTSSCDAKAGPEETTFPR